MTARPPSFEHLRFPIGLGFVAGFIDLFGFLQWYGLLAAHVTGNLIFLAYDITRGNYQLVMKLLALPLFATGVVFATWFIAAITRRGRGPFTAGVLLQVAMLCACMLATATLPPPRGPDDVGAAIPGALALFAMAIQNTMMRLILNNLPPTTVMTGNITQVMTEAARQLAGPDGSGVSRRAVVVGSTLGAFTVGAISGGLLQVTVGYLALLVPVAALLGLLVPGPAPAPAIDRVRP